MKLIVFIFSLSPLLLSAQCYGSFEVYGAGGLSYITNNFGGLARESTPSRRPVFADHFGFGASFAVGQRTLIRTSMQFSRYGDKTIVEDLRWGTQHDGLGGFDPDQPSG